MFNNVLNQLCVEGSVPTWVSSSFPIIKIILCILILIGAIIMICSVLITESNADGAGVITGDSNTYFNRNKGKSLQGKVKKITVIDAITLLCLCIVFLILSAIY